MPDSINKAEQDFNKSIQFLQKEIATIRSGRAHPSLVDGIVVEAYDTKTSLSQLASINVPDGRVITITPWDKSILGNIEKAIRQADIGINPVNEGSMIRLVMPQLTEETRKNLIKILNQKLEQGRVSIRKVRDQIKDEIVKAEKAKEVSEDEKFNLLKKLDDKTADFNNKIKEIGEKKEMEIMTI